MGMRISVVLLVAWMASSGGVSAKPNVLLFFTDDQRPSTIGALGNSDVQTPTLDRLVEEGVAFRRAYMMGGMTGATCIPSRAMLHTGRHLFHLRKMGREIGDDTPTLGETFRGAGYHTYFSGKRHAMSREVIRRGYESGGVVMGFAGYFTDKRRMPIHDWDPKAEYKAATGYVVTGDDGERLPVGEVKRRKLKREDITPGPFATELYIDPAVEFIRGYKEDRPFFMYVALSAPHDPHEAPESIRTLYDPDALKMPPNLRPMHPFDNGEMTVRDEKLAAHPRDPEVIRQRTADYYSSVTFIDRQFARLVKALEEAGQRENTIIVFMGDSGLAVGQHGLLGKQNLYDDSGIGIPWIMSGPGVPKKVQSRSLVCSHDLYPTLCDLAGVPVPKSLDGRSLVHLFAKPGGRHRSFVYAAYRDVQRSVIGPRYKLIEYVPQERTVKGKTATVGARSSQLFDLQNDPWESANLIANPELAGIVKQLREQMAAERIVHGDGTDAGRSGYPDMHDTYARFWDVHSNGG